MWPILLKFNLSNWYFLIPLFFSIFLISCPLAFVDVNYLWFYFFVLSIYFFTIVIEVVRLSSNFSEGIKILLVIIQANLLPGFGMLLGFFKLIFDKITFRKN